MVNAGAIDIIPGHLPRVVDSEDIGDECVRNGEDGEAARQVHIGLAGIPGAIKLPLEFARII